MYKQRRFDIAYHFQILSLWNKKFPLDVLNMKLIIVNYHKMATTLYIIYDLRLVIRV